MSATSRPADLVRDAIKINVLPAYLPSVMWDESEQPFTSPDSKIIYVKLSGSPVNAFIRVGDAQVHLFSRENATYSELDTLYTESLAACEYLMNTNFILQDDCNSKVESVIEHVTGPYRTDKNRYYYRFTVRVLS